MRTLVVVDHPDTTSLTHHVARRLADDIAHRGDDVAIADLHAEGFDPRFTLTDRQRYSADGPLPSDVEAEQRRLDDVDHLVLVFPVYWWSVPATLKGWIDRVFVRGWAFDDTTVPVTRKLGHLTVHLVAVAGEDAAGFAKRGYDAAMATQLETGVIGYCGARLGARVTVHSSETTSRNELARAVDDAVTSVATAQVGVPV